MMQESHTIIKTNALTHAVGNMLGMPVQRIEYQAKSLQGGTLGNVQLVTGTAATADGEIRPYRIVLKSQKQWMRPGDPDSWRREYDLSQTDFPVVFSQTFRRPACYHAEIQNDENQLWLEYISGVSGVQLTLDDLERAAFEIGRFQGKYHRQSEVLRHITCFGDVDYMRRDFDQWTPDTVEYRWLRSADCTLPRHLQKMLIDTQDQSDTIFKELRRLPQVLCHRDFWTENIFISDKEIILIDWDCVGWGWIGEDVASLIADETEAPLIGLYAQRLTSAYCSGLSEFMDPPLTSALPIREMILIKFGYRFLQQVMFSPSPEKKAEAIVALEQIDTLRHADVK